LLVELNNNLFRIENQGFKNRFIYFHNTDLLEMNSGNRMASFTMKKSG